MAEYFAGFLPNPGGFTVLFPDLPGCTAAGRTLEEAAGKAAVALAGFLKKLGSQAPAASRIEAVREKLSGRAAVIRLVDTFDAELLKASQLFSSSEAVSFDEGIGWAR